MGSCTARHSGLSGSFSRRNSSLFSLHLRRCWYFRSSLPLPAEQCFHNEEDTDGTVCSRETACHGAQTHGHGPALEGLAPRWGDWRRGLRVPVGVWKTQLNTGGVQSRLPESCAWQRVDAVLSGCFQWVSLWMSLQVLRGERKPSTETAFFSVLQLCHLSGLLRASPGS